MRLPLPQSNASDTFTGDAARNNAQSEAGKEVTDFAAQLHGPPQTKRLLNALAGVLLGVTRRRAAEDSTRKDVYALPDGNRKEGVASSNSSATPFPEPDRIAQEAYLNDLCLYLTSGTRTTETDQTAGTSPPIPLPLPKSGRPQHARELFMRLAKSHYWRRTLLIPLLRRWWQEGPHSVFSLILLQSVTDAIREELLSTTSGNTEKALVNMQLVTCKSDGVASNERLLRSEAMQGLEELLKATGSFRGLCLGVEAITRSHINNLQARVTIILMGSVCDAGKDTPTGRAQAEIERLVNASTQYVWRDVFAFLSRTMSDVGVAFRESVWMFLMTLLSGYTGALLLLENDSCVAQHNPVVVQAQRMFIERMQEHLRGYLTVRLTSDNVTTDSSLATVHNVVCRQSFFWRASLEVEVAMESLPFAFRSNSLVLSWARRLVSTAWGNAFRLVQSLVRAQEATEDVPDTVESTDSMLFAIRRRYRQLLEEHLELLASEDLRCFAGTKRLRWEDADAGGEPGGGSVTAPTVRTSSLCWSSYVTEYFLRTYHPSCFTVLSLIEQDTLVALLRQLHTVIVNGESDALRVSVAALITSIDSNEVEAQKTILQWHLRHVHDKIVRAFGEDALLLMCLLRALFVFYERIGKTNLNVCSVLRETLLPILAMLCSEHHSSSDYHDDEEPYYESQQCIMTLLASGFLALPWDLRGIRVRLMLHNCIGARLQDAFSAEEALAEVDHLFELYVDGRHTPEDSAAALCDDLSQDPVLQLLASGGEATTAITMDVMDDLFHPETPVHFPAPCGTLLLMSIFRTLSLNFLRLRAEWEQQNEHAREGAMDYLGREATFCTLRDIGVFRVLIQLAHRMVLGFQLQPVGLLRLWLSYMSHLFTHIVPPLTEDDEISLMMPHAGDRLSSRAEDGSSRRAYKRSPNETSQGELRALLGELLADLALMSLVDSEAVMQCPSAAPHRPGGPKWLQKQAQRSQDVLILQRVLPVLVLEELCYALRVPIEDLGTEGADPAFARHVGKMVEQSFLGVLGVFAFCQRMELFVVPGSLADRRAAALLQTLWSAVEMGSMVMASM
ncbi:hypothetical protein TraAM80_04801 [Trypanosoma rangeli]|uniref:Uncharacterized protein n=1 Tax=Trypanosoma rangeli TaxID=5698 RepID=A0A422NHJ2_TRYRA|nr:uncharacterized protein TraAM80_04801 [Trypanosoma rangeli]RNF04948.1 hypothetical protein TraAM80_04801 [Trypanosoma rangeli]|eukprot:RNF04948.1 hypothetical protein TraAM80_04801 [Trypanosoma rangeli]